MFLKTKQHGTELASVVPGDLRAYQVQKERRETQFWVPRVREEDKDFQVIEEVREINYVRSENFTWKP